MVTEVISQVDPDGGGDYTTLAAAELDKRADIVAADLHHRFQCHGGGTNLGTVFFNNTDWTMDNTRKVTIEAAAGEQHSGTWDINKAYISTASSTPCIDCEVERVDAIGIQMRNTGSGGSLYLGDQNWESCLIDQCLFENGSSAIRFFLISTSGVFDDPFIRNCVMYDPGGNQGIDLSAPKTIKVKNCTIRGGASAVRTNHASAVANCVNVYGSTTAGTAFLQTNGTLNQTKCASDDTSASDVGLQSIAHSTLNFVNVSVGTEDYHLVAGTLLIGAGQTDAEVTVDFEGDARATPYDIGADQTASAGTTTVGSARRRRRKRRLVA